MCLSHYFLLICSMKYACPDGLHITTGFVKKLKRTLIQSHRKSKINPQVTLWILCFFSLEELLRSKQYDLNTLNTKDCFEMNVTHKWPFYNHFWPFLPYVCSSFTKLRFRQSFEMLNGSKSEFFQELWHKMQIFPFSLFWDFVQKHTFALLHFLCFVS